MLTDSYLAQVNKKTKSSLGCLKGADMELVAITELPPFNSGQGAYHSSNKPPDYWHCGEEECHHHSFHRQQQAVDT